MADEREDDGREEVGDGGGDVPEGAIPRPRSLGPPQRVTATRHTFVPFGDRQRFVTTRRYRPSMYDDDPDQWEPEGARRSLDVETALHREVDDLREQLHQAMQMLTALATGDQAAGNEAARQFLIAQGLPVPEAIRPGLPVDAAAATGSPGRIASGTGRPWAIKNCRAASLPAA